MISTRRAPAVAVAAPAAAKRASSYRAGARSALAKALAEAETKAAVPGADPVFAAIVAHLTASVAQHAASEAEGASKPGTAAYRAAEAAQSAASARDGDTLHALLTCQPTTIAGLVALLEHVGQPEGFICDRKERTGETILSGPHQCTPIGEEVLAFPLHLAEIVRRLGVMNVDPDQSQRDEDLINDLVSEVDVARGIEAAIFGLDESPGDKSMWRGLLRLQQKHIESLAQIKDRLADFMGYKRADDDEADVDPESDEKVRS